MVNEYEVGIIFLPSITQEGLDNEVEKIKKFLESCEGEVTGIEDWGIKKFAYKVKKQTEGRYVFLRFLLPPSKVKELNEILRVNANVLRHIIVKQCKKPKEG
jgi:small subunit ribosomal protein S6